MSTATVVSQPYPVKTSHVSLQEAITAGKYGRVNDDITPEHFPISGEIVVDTELVLYHPNREVTTDDVLKQLDELRLRAATLTELLAFGETYPDAQREFPILALGSSWVGSGGLRYVPCLNGWHARRGLYLDWFFDEWDRSCRFAAVRK